MQTSARWRRDSLPNATYLGFTGTPIESTDVNTPAVFGNYVDLYDIAQAVEDGATVRIYYESRLAKIKLSEAAQRILTYDKQVYVLPKHLDEKVAKLHLERIGAQVTTLRPEQAAYIGVPVEGPFKADHYRY